MCDSYSKGLNFCGTQIRRKREIETKEQAKIIFEKT